MQLKIIKNKIYKIQENLLTKFPKTFQNKTPPKYSQLIYTKPLPTELEYQILTQLFTLYITTRKFKKASKFLLLNKEFSNILFKRIFKIQLPPLNSIINFIKMIFLIDTFYTKLFKQPNIYQCEYFILDVSLSEYYPTPLSPWDLIQKRNDSTLTIIQILSIYPPTQNSNKNMISFTTGKSYGDIVWILDYKNQNSIITTIPENIKRPIIAIMPTREDGLIVNINKTSKNLEWKGFSNLCKLSFGINTGVFGVRESKQEDELIVFEF
jgi:hypothetical protein